MPPLWRGAHSVEYVCHGRYGVAGTSTAPSSVTTGDAAAYRQLPYIYGRSPYTGSRNTSDETTGLLTQQLSRGRCLLHKL